MIGVDGSVRVLTRAPVSTSASRVRGDERHRERPASSRHHRAIDNSGSMDEEARLVQET